MGVATSKSTTKARGPRGRPWCRDATLDPCRPNTCSSADETVGTVREAPLKIWHLDREHSPSFIDGKSLINGGFNGKIIYKMGLPYGLYMVNIPQ